MFVSWQIVPANYVYDQAGYVFINKMYMMS